MNEGIYYLRLNGKVEGPFSIGQIYDMWAARKINSQTPFARFEEMDKWQPLSELTLKISAPKPLGAKPPTSEPSAAAPPRQRTTAPPETEEYVPAMVYPREQKALASEGQSQTLLPKFRKNVLTNFSIASAVCIVSGILMVGYNLVFSSAPGEAKDIRQDFLMMRQNAVITGVGLILMGGLLIVARQITQVLASSAVKKDDRKPSPLS